MLVRSGGSGTQHVAVVGLLLSNETPHKKSADVIRRFVRGTFRSYEITYTSYTSLWPKSFSTKNLRRLFCSEKSSRTLFLKSEMSLGFARSISHTFQFQRSDAFLPQEIAKFEKNNFKIILYLRSALGLTVFRSEQRLEQSFRLSQCFRSIPLSLQYIEIRCCAGA